MIRVLQVVGKMNLGGAETRLMALAKSTDKSEFYFDFCVFQDDSGDYADEIRKLGFGIVRCKLSEGIFGFSRYFRQLLRKGRYDAVHCHVHEFSGLPLRLAAKEGAPIRIIHLRTTNDVSRQGLYRFLYRRLLTGWIKKYSTKIVSVSESAMVAFMGSQWKDDSRTEVIYNGLDVRPFQIPCNRAEVLSEFDIPVSAKVVIHVGNFKPAKDHEAFINIAEIVINKEKNTYFLLVGDGPLISQIQDLAVTKGLQSRIRFAGSRNDIPRLLLAGDCFLFPSRREGLPGAVLEALAAGLPVVASDIAPIREIASESPNIYVVPAGKTQEFAYKVVELLNKVPAKRAPGQIPDRFNFNHYVRKIQALYTHYNI